MTKWRELGHEKCSLTVKNDDTSIEAIIFKDNEMYFGFININGHTWAEDFAGSNREEVKEHIMMCLKRSAISIIEACV